MTTIAVPNANSPQLLTRLIEALARGVRSTRSLCSFALVRYALLRPLDPPDRLVPVLSFLALAPTVPPLARLCLLSLFVFVFPSLAAL